MEISIVVCTYNRSSLLKQCLASLEKLIVPEGLSQEIIVIDNNSTDNTKDVINAFKLGTKLNIRYVVEPSQGVSYARNRGVSESRGEAVLFIDDDCVADTLWLKGLVTLFRERDAECIGGKVIPLDWPAKTPKWLTTELYPYITVYDKGESIRELTSLDGTPISSNVIYKRSVFKTIGLFDTALGRVGLGSTYGGEEQDLNKRILKSGGRIFYQPEAVVYHVIRPEMFTKRYFRTMDFHTGEKNAFLFFGEYTKRNIFGIPLFIISQFLGSLLRYIKHIFMNGYNNSFRQELYCWYFLGFMHGRIKYFRTCKKVKKI
jgi:glucosyl-dolichyl phosphate glucuronosyltransferase